MHMAQSHDRTKELALNIIPVCKLSASLIAGQLFSFARLKQRKLRVTILMCVCTI